MVPALGARSLSGVIRPPLPEPWGCLLTGSRTKPLGRSTVTQWLLLRVTGCLRSEGTDSHPLSEMISPVSFLEQEHLSPSEPVTRDQPEPWPLLGGRNSDTIGSVGLWVRASRHRHRHRCGRRPWGQCRTHLQPCGRFSPHGKPLSCVRRPEHGVAGEDGDGGQGATLEFHLPHLGCTQAAPGRRCALRLAAL